jgi:hypothetical protein
VKMTVESAAEKSRGEVPADGDGLCGSPAEADEAAGTESVPATDRSKFASARTRPKRRWRGSP